MSPFLRRRSRKDRPLTSTTHAALINVTPAAKDVEALERKRRELAERLKNSWTSERK